MTWDAGFVLAGLVLLHGCGRTGPPLEARDAHPSPPEVAGNGGGSAAKDATDESQGGAGGSSVQHWEPIAKLHQCEVERLANASAFDVFDWAPCDGIDACEVAVFPTWVLEPPPTKSSGTRLRNVSHVHDDGADVRLLLVIDGFMGQQWPEITWVTDSEGNALDAFRIVGPSWDCTWGTTGIWGARMGAILLTLNDPAPLPPQDMLLARIGDPSTVAYADVTDSFSAFNAMGETRWAYGHGLRMASVSNHTGFDAHVVASLNMGDGFLEGLTSAGDHFLFDKITYGLPSGHLREIHITDGVNAAVPYLTPPPGSDYFTSAYANSHVFWLRGMEKPEPYGEKFGTIEVWASPFSPDGSKLSPQFVGKTPHEFNPIRAVGGWARYATRTQGGVEVWNAMTKESRLATTGSYGNTWSMVGLTRAHLWVITDLDGDNSGDYMLRHAVV